MNSNDIIALARAGFNVDQIIKIYNSMEATQITANTSAQTSIDASAQTQVPAHSSVVQSSVSPSFKGETWTHEQLGDLIKSSVGDAMQNYNIITSKQPTVQTVDEILAEIINPKEV